MLKAEGKTSIKDIAARAGVSISTVSRVINGKTNLQPGVVEKVLAAVGELDYKPSPIASNLARKHEPKVDAPGKFKTGVLGFLVRNPAAETFLPDQHDFLRGAESVFQRHGLGMMFGSFDEQIRRGEIPPMVARGQVDGVILNCSSIPVSAWVERLATLTPLVLLNCRHDTVTKTFHAVTCDNLASTSRMMRYLHGLGHRRIGFLEVVDINAPTDMLRTERNFDHEQRLTGYLDSVRKLGLSFQEGYWQKAVHDWGDNTLDDAMDVAAAAVAAQGPERPTAFFCPAAVYAIALCKALRKVGLSVPGDLSVTGFANIQAAALNEPPLTIMAIPYEEMGRAAASLLIELIGTPNMTSRQIAIDCQLIERQSCANITPERRP